jgi:hypothetical protein
LGARHPPEAADDLAAVAAIGAEVRGRMKEAIADLLRRRSKHFGSVFRGSVFTPEETAG